MKLEDLIKKIKDILKFQIFIGKQEVNIVVGRIPASATEKFELFKEKKYNLIRSDLSEEFKKVCELSSTELLSKISSYLESELLASISLAIAVIEAEDKGDFEKNKRLFHVLEERFKEGRKIYNLLRSGEFHERILPYLEILKRKCNSDAEIKKEFTEYLKEMLSFYPFAVWVDLDTPDEKVIIEFLKRIFVTPVIRIYGRGQTISKTRKICEEIRKILEACSIEAVWKENPHRIGQTEALDITVVFPKKYWEILM
jgi:hypothetical protein